MEKEYIYISRACSFDIYSKLNLKPNIAAMKFNYSIIKGLSEYHKAHSYYVFDSSFKKTETTKNENIIFHFIPSYSSLKRAQYFFKELFKLSQEKNKEYVLIADALCFGDSLIALLFSKFFHWKSLGIFTDLPEYINYVPEDKRSLKDKIILKLQYSVYHMYDFYVLLTKNMMNKISKSTSKNSIIIEGFADLDLFNNIHSEKKKQILYAGSLHKEYGIENLIKGFEMFCEENKEYCLVIYGIGNYQKEIEELVQKNNNIYYKGLADIRDILKEECDSYLLVNPRPTYSGVEGYNYTKYSFPSKNIEYMCSGTPMLGVKLPGIPEEYLNFFYIISDSSPKGICDALNKTLNKTQDELNEMGQKAKEFMRNNKNYRYQVKQIIKKFNI